MEYVKYNPEYNDVAQSVDYLNRAFARARKDYIDITGERSVKSRWGKGTTIYQFEVDYCYIINEIQQGSIYVVAKNIAQANVIIQRLQDAIPATPVNH